MDIRTYRAVTMHEALEMVRCDLGPEAAVLHTREVPKGGLFGWLRGARQIEVTASVNVNVPSRLPPRPPVESQTLADMRPVPQPQWSRTPPSRAPCPFPTR